MKKFINYFLSFFKKDDPFFYGNSKLKDNFFSRLFYCPHPFTNWSLNPHSTIDKNLIHTKEGFRKTSEYNSITDELKSFDYNCDIYCLGGSTTYCDGLKDYSDTWPYKLRNLLSKKKKRFLVNGGVGGWSTIQSLIRFSSWGAILKPKITIFYQSKNDLTPLLNGREIEKKIFPLMENIMLQYDTSLNSNPKKYKKNNYGVASVYGKDIYVDEKGLGRLTSEWKDLYAVRCKMAIELAKMWNGKVIFIPELISKKSIYYKSICEMHDVMKKVSENNKNSLFLDLRDEIEIDKNNFIDNLHFTKLGCDKFSSMLYKNIDKIL